jgi:hypothetical protein
MARPKTIKVISTGTEFGFSTASEYIYGCPRKAWLKKFGEPTTQAEAPLLGSCGHALLAEFYRGKLNKTNIETLILVDQDGLPIDGKIVRKVKQIFTHYRARFTPQSLGRVVAVEQLIRGKLWGGQTTMRLDLAVSITKRDADRIHKARGLRLQPGIWIVDHKFVGNASPMTMERYRWSLQFSWYYELAKQELFHKKLQGVLINICTKARVPEFKLIPVPATDARTRIQLATILGALDQRGWPIPEKPKPYANPERCFDYGSLCPFWVDNQCKRV